jgi:predicted dehydrogenase
MNIAVIGSGYWGVNYVRTFSELPGSKVVLVCDASEDRLRAVRERYPLIATTSSLEETLANRWIDAVVIATPAGTHFQVARECLLRGKHVLVEKPVTTTVEDAQSLVAIAGQQKRVLMVGHTFLFNAGIRKMKELVWGEDFGRVYYLHATRTNMGPIREDVNAMWDLGAHDIAIFNYLLGQLPERVSAVAAKPLGKKQEDVVFATLTYPGGVIANIHVSWLDPNKVREVVAVGGRRRIVFDDLNNSERVRIYEKGVTHGETHGQPQARSFGEFRLLVRDGDIISPRVEPSEPLRNLATAFIDCVTHDKTPESDGRAGVAVVKTLQAIDRSLAENGASIDVK